MPLAFSFLWQSMQVPDCALTSWNAACSRVFIGGVAGLMWQSEHACCSAVAGFSGFDGWWQDVHVLPSRSACSLWSRVLRGLLLAR